MVIVSMEVVCELPVPRDALARLILGDGQGRRTRVQVGYNRETYLQSVYIMEGLSELP
jgi:hypothetical protein